MAFFSLTRFDILALVQQQVVCIKLWNIFSEWCYVSTAYVELYCFIVQLKGFLFYAIMQFVIFPAHTLACIQLLHKVEELKLNLQAHLSKAS